MESTNYIILLVVCFLVSVHYVTKIIDWYTQRKLNKFKDVKSEFISDLYKLQKKWTDRGEFDYGQGINTVILHFSIPKEPEASTVYGKEIQKKLKELEEDEQS